MPTSSFTGWYPDPGAYPYATDGFCATGGAAFYGSTSLVIRAFRNSLNANLQETRLHVVGQTMDAAAINAYMDLGVVPNLVGNYVAYGLAFDKATGRAYIRTGYFNNSGPSTYNKIFMVHLTPTCDGIAPDAVTGIAADDIGPRELTLSWTAPNDASGILDGAVSYDVRYSTAPIDDANWNAADQLTGEPQPGSAGSTDGMGVTGLTADTDYYFAVKSTERVADRELGRDLGDGEAGRLRGQRRGARDARVHFDDDEAAVRGIDRELHVRAAGLDADLAQHRDRGVAHALVFLVGQRQRRRHRDRVAGMHAHRIEVLDRADDDAIVVLVAHHLHLELFPAEHRFLDQHLEVGEASMPRSAISMNSALL